MTMTISTSLIQSINPAAGIRRPKIILLRFRTSQSPCPSTKSQPLYRRQEFSSSCCIGTRQKYEATYPKQHSLQTQQKSNHSQLGPFIQDSGSHREIRPPRSVQATYLRPLRRDSRHGIPACDLQLRSYNVRNLELMADFALRAAYYLGLPVSGAIPLPRLVERWTVSKSVFAHKKAQENFERITLRRLVQVKDSNPDSVHIWLAFLRKHAYYGVGMKANVWGHETLGFGESMDLNLNNSGQSVNSRWALFGRRRNPHTAEQVTDQLRDGRL